jgi:hypothetical protein
MKKKSLLIIGILSLLVLLGLGYFFILRQDKAEPPAQPEASKIEPGTPDVSPTEAKKQPSYSGQIVLKAVGGFSGDGFAFREYDGQLFTHQISANLQGPPEGKFYEGWLVKNEPDLAFFSTGRLAEKDGQYILSLISNTDQRDFNQAVVTLETETNGLDGIPETHVLEGTFEN